MTKVFERVLVVMFENQYRSYAMQDPFLRKLASAGADMGNYFGCFHPSQTNYLASLAGEVCGVTNDTPPAAPLPQQTLVDLLEAGGVSWKAYMEAYPGEDWNAAWKSPDYPASQQPVNEYPSGDDGQLARYYRKHNAFASYHTIQADPKRWEKIVSEEQFWLDLQNKGAGLAEYNWFTPDIWNDGHYLYNTHIETDPRTLLITQLSAWMEYVFLAAPSADDVQNGVFPGGPGKLGLNLDVDLLLRDPKAAWDQSLVPPGTLIVITFDEADYDAQGYDTNYDGPNQIYTVLLGDMIEPGTVVDTPFNHYSLIRTVQKNYGLGSLEKNDQRANWFRFLWSREFAWDQPQDSGLSSGNQLALAHLKGDACLVTDDAQGNLLMSRFDGQSWAPAQKTGLSASGPLAMAALGEELFLVLSDDAGNLSMARSSADGNWSDPQPLGVSATGSLAMTSFHDTADGQRKLMLCWTAEGGFIRYQIFAGGSWGDPGEVGQLTDGPMVAGQLGASLYLVYKQRNTRKMSMTSYNLAPFNAFKAVTFDNRPAPQNDTSFHQWSPADRPVGHFALKMSALQNDYQTIGRLAMASIEGEMHLVHRGAYDDTPQAFTEYFGLTGIFTAADPLTNGFGTLRQAGWTLEQAWPQVQLDPDSPIVMSSDGRRLLLVWRPPGTRSLSFARAQYS